MLEKIEAINEGIVKGEVAAARRELRRLLQRKIPPALRCRVAGLARRVDMPLMGIRLLNSVVRPETGHRSRATPAEIAEYSGCLTFIGASAEAIQLLKGVSPASCPESLLYRAFAHFAEWEYGEAVPLLQQYVSVASLTEYARAIGKVNLLAALSHERRYPEALCLRDQLAEECQAKGYQRLLANCYELTAGIFFHQREVEKTQAVLDQAERLASANGSMDHFYIRKWRVLLDFLLHPQQESSVSALHALGAEAQERGLWETVRQCDAYESFLTKNLSLWQRVYYGTPFPHFREWLLKEYGLERTPEGFVLSLGNGSPTAIFDLATGKLEGSKTLPLKAGQISHRLLQVFFADRYRPLRVAVAHHALFPDEFFNPASSAHRVHEAVRRLRSELTAKKIPLTIEENEGFYRIKAKKPVGIRYSGTVAAPSPQLADYLRLYAQWREGEFSVQESMRCLNVSKRTAIRALNRLVEEGWANRLGASSTTRYRLNKR